LAKVAAVSAIKLMHMKVEHSPSPNTTARVRQMIGAAYVPNNIG
jgi:hypothetical protein